MGGQTIDNNGGSEFRLVDLTDSEARGGASADSHLGSTSLLVRVCALLLAFSIAIAGTGVLAPTTVLAGR